jgi:hypothetical protein
LTLLLKQYNILPGYKMFTKHTVKIYRKPVCYRPIENPLPKEFLYYDKDGFELNRAEQKYYKAMEHPIHYPILNHTCWQEPWMSIEHPTLFIDHAMILQRASYVGDARRQLYSLRNKIPYADLIMRTRTKWGFDFALDSVDKDGNVFEVIHIEYDSYSYAEFMETLGKFEETLRNKDWEDAAKYVLENKSKWNVLKGFEQNHWKAQKLIGWERAEYTEKST